jgi:hypothetical protein
LWGHPLGGQGVLQQTCATKNQSTNTCRSVHCKYASYRETVNVILTQVIAATALSYYLDFEKKYGLEVIGEVPTGWVLLWNVKLMCTLFAPDYQLQSCPPPNGSEKRSSMGLLSQL